VVILGHEVERPPGVVDCVGYSAKHQRLPGPVHGD
jgi:hypothetical protein